MIKKIIFGIVIGLLVLMTAVGFIYADNKDTTSKSNNKQELNKEKTSIEDDENEDLDDVENEDPNIFHITANCNHGGTISPKKNQSVKKGDSITFTATVINNSYKLEWLRVDNIKYYDRTTYTFTDVEKNHTIHAHFKKIGKK